MSGAAIRSEHGWEDRSIPQVLAGPAADQLLATDAARLLAPIWARVGFFRHRGAQMWKRRQVCGDSSVREVG